jgi:hypothetical protein
MCKLKSGWLRTALGKETAAWHLRRDGYYAVVSEVLCFEIFRWSEQILFYATKNGRLIIFASTLFQTEPKAQLQS